MSGLGDKLQQWLLGFPGWEGEPSLDFVEDGPGNAGLFCLGAEEIGQRTDLMGNVQADIRCRFALMRRLVPGQDGLKWLLELQDWARRQAAAGLMPCFGDVPGQERVLVQKGSLQEVSRLGTNLCTVNIQVEFVKVYEVKEK